MSKYPKISELTYDQKCHMAWRIDRYTGWGILSAARLMRGQLGDMGIEDAFLKCDMTPRAAKLHSAAVVKYSPETYVPLKS